VHIQNVLPRDSIPSIDDPTFSTDYFGDEKDEVIVVETTPAKAYPVRILSYHEIVNDVVQESDRLNSERGSPDDSTDDSRPIAVTWCPICASAVVYDRRVDGRVLTFGTSGKLADDALVMYDRETGSEWKQPIGTAIGGPLEGSELRVVPASLTSFESFRERFPDGVVLQPVRGEGDGAAYDMTGYERYDEAAGFGLQEMRGEGPERSWDRTDIDAKTTVLGIVHDEEAVGYPVPEVRDAGGMITDTVGGLPIVVVTTDRGIHAYENPGFEFEVDSGSLSADGTTWEPETGKSMDGRHLNRVPSRRLYAFAWQDDHGPDSFYGLT
jgi:hypothetical protein